MPASDQSDPVVLYGYVDYAGLPDSSPFVAKLEAYLRLAGGWFGLSWFGKGAGEGSSPASLGAWELQSLEGR